MSNRRLLADLLTPAEFELREAENGKEAAEIREAWEPDFIVMDLRMPVMDALKRPCGSKLPQNAGRRPLLP